jgi:hypothetical protein
MASFSNYKSTVVTASNTAAGVSAGVTVYATRANLPSSGNSEGDQAYVTENNRLYIWNGSGWYNIALINLAPSIQSVLDSDGGTTPFALSIEGVATTITITATDSDGDPITYTAEADSDFGGLATISQESNVFTVTPFSQDSATTESGTITFKADDGVNIASSGIQTFTLVFLSEYWDETVLSIGTSSTDGLDNSTFVDRSTNAHTVTPTGAPTQTVFHPYLDNWSVEFDGTNGLDIPDDASLQFGTGDFTVEFWFNASSVSGTRGIVAKRDSTSNYWRILIANGVLNFQSAVGGISNIARAGGYGNETVVANRWYHVAVCKESGTLSFFLDGNLVESATHSQNLDLVGSDVHIGQLESNSYDFLGYVSNVRLVKGVSLYSGASFTVPTVNLTNVSGTGLLTCQSNRIMDNSSSNHNISSNDTTSPKISALNPFGQESEYAVGENKGSVSLDGSSNYMTISDTTAFDFSSGYTCVEAWIYPNSIATGGGRNHIFTRGQSVSPYNGVYLRLENGYPDLAGSNNDLQSPTICKTKEWSHVVFQFNPNGEQSIWLNGVRVADRSNGPSTVEVDVTNGIGHYDGGSIFDGYISDLKIRNGVSAFYSGATITVPTSPVGNTNASLYLPMDNAGIFDKTGNYALTLNGDVATSTTQTKYADTAMYFDGTGDYIQIPDDDNFELTSDFTIEFWAYSTGVATSGYQSIIGGNGSGSNGWNIYARQGSEIIYFFHSSFLITSSAGDFPANQWNHVAVTRSGSDIKMFVGGTQVGSTASSSATLNQNDANAGTRIGYDINANGYYTGYLENLQILKGIAKYTTNFTPPTQEQGRTYQVTS